jgi:hypothetical protein
MRPKLLAFIAGMLVSILLVCVALSAAGRPGTFLIGAALGGSPFSYIGYCEFSGSAIMRACDEGVTIAICGSRCAGPGAEVRFGAGPRVGADWSVSYEAAVEVLWRVGQDEMVGVGLVARRNQWTVVLEIEFRPGGDWWLAPG